VSASCRISRRAVYSIYQGHPNSRDAGADVEASFHQPTRHVLHATEERAPARCRRQGSSRLGGLLALRQAWRSVALRGMMDIYSADPSTNVVGCSHKELQSSACRAASQASLKKHLAEPFGRANGLAKRAHGPLARPSAPVEIFVDAVELCFPVSDVLRRARAYFEHKYVKVASEARGPASCRAGGFRGRGASAPPPAKS
jgi:hypothetical protein